ncbi:MAG TPA: SpoIIE family protein phosphatase [Pseudonocardia sp.]|nr:SpoIIE family protein phosphatase [Pseudonocardia sp.]
MAANRSALTSIDITIDGPAPRWLSDFSAAPPSRESGAGATGSIGDRTFQTYRTPLDDGSVMWWLLDDTDRLEATQALAVERERTEFMADASNLLLSSLNIDRCMEVTAALAAQHLADAATVIAPSTTGRHQVISSNRDGKLTLRTIRTNPATVAGLNEALQGFPPVPSRWIDPGTVPDWALPDDFSGPIGSVVVTPLPGHGVPAGALILLRRSNHAAFSDGEESFARIFAARAGVALSAARMYSEQAATTATLMSELLPPSLHTVNGIEFAGTYRTSEYSDQVGGDFYDVHPGADDDAETLVVCGDVCGKGLEAAVLTGKIRTTLAALLPLADSHQRMLELLNGSLLGSHSRFATLVLASVSRLADRVRLRLTSAGHMPPLIVRLDGAVEEVHTRGTLVGVLPEIRSNTVEVELAPGETCLLYTDGITEARGRLSDGELFGEARLQQALSECASMPASAVTERIQMLASQWAGTRRTDDMAAVAITARRPAGGGSGGSRYTA